MICFTAVNDEVIFRGLSLGYNHKIGRDLDFCSMISLPNTFSPPVITSLENRNHYEPTSDIKLIGLILRAGLAQVMSEVTPVIVEDTYFPNTKNWALVHWIVCNNSTHFGKTISLSAGSFQNANVYIQKNTGTHTEYLFTIEPKKTTSLMFEKDQDISLIFEDDKLSFVGSIAPKPIKLQD